LPGQDDEGSLPFAGPQTTNLSCIPCPSVFSPGLSKGLGITNTDFAALFLCNAMTMSRRRVRRVSQSQPQTMAETVLDTFLSLDGSGAGAENRPKSPPNYLLDLTLDQNSCGNNDTAHPHAATGSEKPMLQTVQSWLDDPDSPLCLFAEIFHFREERKQALAEIDGIYAGLTFLDKAENGSGAPGLRHSSAGLDDATWRGLAQVGVQHR